MSYALLVLRVVLGLIMAAHGAQKLFGWFGGGGPQGTAAMFGQLRFRAPLLLAFGAGLAELGGGLLFAAGLATPLAAFAIAVMMVNAIATVHWRNGFWNTNGGYEFNLLIFTAAVVLAVTGPGRFSLDAFLGWADHISGIWWGVAIVALSGIVSALTLTVGRRPVEARPPSSEPARAGKAESSTR